MKNPDCFLAPEPRAHILNHAFEIAHELRIGVIRRSDRNILPMISEIKDDEIERVKEMPPVGKVGVYCETIAVRHQYPGALRVAVTPDANCSPIIEGDVECCAWGWQFKGHQVCSICCLEPIGDPVHEYETRQRRISC